MHFLTSALSYFLLLSLDCVKVPRNIVADGILYDGGDRIQSSYPISVTRGAYPETPGSLLAGAVEVKDTTLWGTLFEAPTGSDVSIAQRAFQFSAFYYMAKDDGTVVTEPGGNIVTLNRGQGSMVHVKKGNQISSTKPIQVDLVTGRVNSMYAMRWFSMSPRDQWEKEYLAPVGDSYAHTKVLLYNPGPAKNYIQVYYTNSKNRTKRMRGTLSANQVVTTATIPTGSSAWIIGENPIAALSVTDASGKTSANQNTGGQWYDWGYPVVPIKHLTSQVLIGWGYGCTDNNCGTDEDRSKVWVAPVADADIYVDYSNKGSDYAMYPVDKYHGVKIHDHVDHDMTGALIFGVERGTGPTGPGVDIAAAWGQDASVSRNKQWISLDLGTVILPFTTVKVSKTADKKIVKVGDVLVYTIRVS